MRACRVYDDQIINLDLVTDAVWEAGVVEITGQPAPRYLVVSFAAPSGGSCRILRFKGEPAQGLWKYLTTQCIDILNR